MKRYWILAALGALCLGGAAVWLGGLNQDEGWYLYAANLVAEGRRLYADFAYTQGPLLPLVYARFTWVWQAWGLLGARVFTLLLGLASIGLFCLTAVLLAPKGRRSLAGVATALALGCNLYHLYYLAIPKTYALASLLVALGAALLAAAAHVRRLRPLAVLLAGYALALAAGARISLGATLAVAGFWLLFDYGRWRWSFLWFGIGGLAGLAQVYAPFLLDGASCKGLMAAQAYHAARGGFDPVFTVGSLSRLVRWYLPVFVLFGLGVVAYGRRKVALSATVPTEKESRTEAVTWLLLVAFLAVFAVQMLAPFPYEDYQVPVMGLLAIVASVRASALAFRPLPLLVLGMTWASAFGSPLLEKWMTNGQDRFWSLKKVKCELAQLRDAALTVEALDPGGELLLTQDLYLAIESRRKVPAGLEMGPFSILTDDEWRALLSLTKCPVAALSGYTFAIEPPSCAERPMEKQLEYWGILKRRYEFVLREEAFGQNATPLLFLKLNAPASAVSMVGQTAKGGVR